MHMTEMIKTKLLKDYNICNSVVNALIFILHCIFYSICLNYSLIIIIINSYIFVTSIRLTHEKLYAMCVK